MVRPKHLCINCGDDDGASPGRSLLPCSMGGMQRDHDWRNVDRPFEEVSWERLEWQLERLSVKLTGSVATATAFLALLHRDEGQVMSHRLAYALYREKAARRARLLGAVADELLRRLPEVAWRSREPIPATPGPESGPETEPGPEPDVWERLEWQLERHRLAYRELERHARGEHAVAVPACPNCAPTLIRSEDGDR